MDPRHTQAGRTLSGGFHAAITHGTLLPVIGCESTHGSSSAHAASYEGEYGEHQEYNEEDLRDSHERAGDSAKPQDRRDERDHKASNGKL